MTKSIHHSSRSLRTAGALALLLCASACATQDDIGGRPAQLPGAGGSSSAAGSADAASGGEDVDAVFVPAPGKLVTLPGEDLDVPAAGDDFLAIAGLATGVLRILQLPDTVDGAWNEVTRFQAAALSLMGTGHLALAARGDSIVLGVPGRLRLRAPAYDGGPGVEQAGGVDVYTRTASGWQAHETLEDPSGAAETDFGSAVALGEGVVAIGTPDAPGGGAVHLFRLAGAPHSHVATIENPGAPDESRFGWSVALRGATLFVGAPTDSRNGSYNGVVHVFDVADALTGTVVHSEVLGAPDAPPGAILQGFGWSLAALPDHVAIGAPGTGVDTSVPGFLRTAGPGAAYLFGESSGAWEKTDSLVAPEGVRLFGSALAARGARLSVGAPEIPLAPREDNDTEFARIETYDGAAHAGTWTRLAPLDVLMHARPTRLPMTQSPIGLIAAGYRNGRTSPVLLVQEQ